MGYRTEGTAIYVGFVYLFVGLCALVPRCDARLLHEAQI